MNRRKFIGLAAGAGLASVTPTLLPGAEVAPSAGETGKPTSRKRVLVRAGISRRPDGSQAPRDSQQTVVRSFDSEGRLAAFIVPVGRRHAFHGAPLHVHHDVDEWITILAGEFVAEVGGERIRLKTGDSLLMPMRVPHRWSIAENPVAGAIHLYTPAGLMDLNFDDAPAGKDEPDTVEQMKADFERYNMSFLGAPLTETEIRNSL